MESSEKEKMMSQALYRASDPELVAERKRARRLLRLLNATTEEEDGERLLLLSELFAQTGPIIEIEPPFYCDYGSNIYLGDHFYANFGCVILDCNPVRIGRNVLCGPYVQLYTAYHPTDPAVRLTGLERAAPIVIGDNVWLGGGAIVGPGVTIGENTTIGAGSVVVKDIPANVIAAGNPCQVIRTLL